MWALLSFAVGLYAVFGVWIVATGGPVFAVIPVIIVSNLWIFVTYRINKKLEFKVRDHNEP
jgi:hypothetical protein